MDEKRIRVLLAKAGLDGHDRGMKVVAMALRDAGCEVIYLGRRNNVRRIIDAAIQEDVDFIGLSILSGSHLPLTKKLMTALKKEKIDIRVIVGGTIPDADIRPLEKMGVAKVFPTGSDLDEIVSYVTGRRVAHPHA